ncbi:MAG: hypothetical protein M1828_002661 [Chrysothrix sp. TS-e1954]|nr:MAG: hypothetical protein M1828_002661 [Chrysothrix sp. TS-e1954]
MKGPVRFQHLHLQGVTAYRHANDIQERLVHRLLAWKSNHTQKTHEPDTFSPTLLTAQFHPVYTCGRREVSTISEGQIKLLRGIDPPNPHKAEFHTALRGGQTTFHGPGQLVVYPILDLKRHGVSPRDYIKLLEDTTIKVCAAYKVEGERTRDLGVWTQGVDGKGKKIAAVGVHMRRHITSHGVGFNINTDLRWFDRAVMCGLAGKGATSLANETGKEDISVHDVANHWIKAFANGLTAGGPWEMRDITEGQLERELDRQQNDDASTTD